MRCPACARRAGGWSRWPTRMRAHGGGRRRWARRMRTRTGRRCWPTRRWKQSTWRRRITCTARRWRRPRPPASPCSARSRWPRRWPMPRPWPRRSGARAFPTAPPSTSATIPRMRPSATLSRPARSARSPRSASPMPAGWMRAGRPTTGGPTRCARGGGALMDLAPHGLDLADYLLGEPVEEIAALTQRRVQRYAVDDGAVLIGRTASGRAAADCTSLTIAPRGCRDGGWRSWAPPGSSWRSAPWGSRGAAPCAASAAASASTLR